MSSNCPCPIGFSTVKHIGHTGIIGRLEQNLKFFLEWGLLNIGGWQDITQGIPTAFAANDASKLMLVNNSPGYIQGQVWQGFRKDWIYESGVQYTDVDGTGHAPLTVQVYISGILQPSGNYSINYPEGKIIFNSAIGLSSDVQAQYSFRHVQVYTAGEANWFRELQLNSWNVDSDHFQQQTDTGEWIIGGKYRIQLPAIVIDTAQAGSITPWSLGDTCLRRDQTVQFYVLTEDKCMKDNLLDTILLQAKKKICLFDVDSARVAGDCPLDCNGKIVSSINYPSLLAKYPWGVARGEESNIDSIIPICQLHEGIVTINYGVYFSNIC